MLLEGQLTQDAAIYPRGLCRAMLRGVSQQLKADKLVKEGCFGVQVPDDDSEVHGSLHGPARGYSGQHVDDPTGQVLKDNLVQEARHKELTYFAVIGFGERASEQSPWGNWKATYHHEMGGREQR